MGTEPIASTACVERTTRPSLHRTTTPRPRLGVRVALDGHGPRPLQQLHATAQEVLLEHRRDLGSFPGRTCWRETTRDTLAPNDENMWTNSTPVTPEPMTVMLPGNTLGG